MQEEHDLLGLEFPDRGERFDRFEESLAYLRAAFDPGGEGFSGKHYRLSNRPIRPLPSRLPLIVGGGGPRRTPRLAGTYADEFNLFAGPPDEMADRITVARSAAEAAGRDPDRLRISVIGPAIAGTDEPAYRANLERISAAHPSGREPDDLEERLADRGLPVGPPDRARDAIAAFEAVGVDRFYLQHLGPFDHDLLEDVFAGLRG
jgi:alkanesulfonate monooxygenase SsuD/methylene tetrahydromethanopterin reductase-like flavin-dependent oxidoreductase (luciferase family)